MSVSNRARRKWTPEEDALLKEAVQFALDESRPLLWRDLAKAVPGRSNKDCRRRWWNSLAEGTAKGLWSEEEDDLLMRAVQQHGPNWRHVAQDVGTRTPDQCSSHWTQVLDPDINHCDWTAKEDEDLLHEVLTHATNWKTISTIHVPKRTTLSLKNRYSTLRLKFQKKAGQEKSKSKSESRKARSSSSSSSSHQQQRTTRGSTPEPKGLGHCPSAILQPHHSRSSGNNNPTSSPYAVSVTGRDVCYSSLPYGVGAMTSSTPSVSTARGSASGSDISEVLTPLTMHGSPMVSDTWPDVMMTDSKACFDVHDPTVFSASFLNSEYTMSPMLDQQDLLSRSSDFDFLTGFAPQPYADVSMNVDGVWP